MGAIFGIPMYALKPETQRTEYKLRLSLGGLGLVISISNRP